MIDTMNIVIRPLRADDARALLSFANTLVDEDTFLQLSGTRLSLTKEKSYIEDALTRMKKHTKIHLVAVHGGQIIGSAEVRRGEKRKAHMGEIGIAVLAPYRGKGVGRKLMESLIAEAKKIKLRMLMLHCFETNDVAISLYKQFGFVVSGLLPDAYLYRGKYVGELTFYTYV
jgi:ribosomal protein S18 acetylase RimI-like enzyme